MSNTSLILFIVAGFCVMMSFLQAWVMKGVNMVYPLGALGCVIAAVLVR